MFPYPSGAGLHVGHPKVIQQQIYTADSEMNDTQFFIQWDSTPSDCLQKTMQ